MEFPFFEANNGNCPYLEDRQWVSHLFLAPSLDQKAYESLINEGFRRSGIIFYKNKCKGCQACVPLRIDVDQFQPSKSQRRILQKNADLTILTEPASFEADSFLLYRKFARVRYQNEGSEEEFFNFLVNSALETQTLKYYQEDKLIGIGWLDFLENSISSVYFAFDPDFAHRSLGTFSVMKEIELCRTLGKKYLHLGFWVEECQAMSYKNRFRPYQLLQDGQWVSFGE